MDDRKQEAIEILREFRNWELRIEDAYNRLLPLREFPKEEVFAILREVCGGGVNQQDVIYQGLMGIKRIWEGEPPAEGDNILEQDDPDMRPEYDFSGGVRGAVKPKACQTCGGEKKICRFEFCRKTEQRGIGRVGCLPCSDWIICPNCGGTGEQPRDPHEGHVEQRSGPWEGRKADRG